jgi:hypothetical protein
MMVITRIVPLSCGRVAGVLYGAMGLVVGAIVSVAALAGGFSAGEALGPLTGGIIGVGAIVLLPLFYGGLGFIVAVIAAWLYNIAAGVTGGLEIDVK